MKKVLVLFGIFSLFQMASYAYLKGETVSDVETLRRQGFSEGTLRAVDLVHTQAVGDGSKYVSRYTPKSHTPIGRSYTRLKQYFDPAQDDYKFGTHQIEFTNTWLGDEAPYATGTRDYNIERL